jgi:hypothetical protein
VNAGLARRHDQSPALARSRELVRPASMEPARRRRRVPALAFAQMRAPECRSGARLLRTTRERAVRRVRTTATAGESGRTRAPGRPSLNRPERRRAGPPPPTGTPIRARAPCEGTTGPRRRPPRNRAARHRRPRGRHDRPQPAAGAPSSPARRPDRLAFYMGCCADRGEGRVTRGQVRPARQTAVRRAPAGALLRSSKAQARRLACSESGRLLPFDRKAALTLPLIAFHATEQRRAAGPRAPHAATLVVN